ncbi:hypothetical protein BDR03DRAFT_834856, partial [Suillus americanus]
SLDTVGIAGFSHDFGSLDGQRASVTEVFDTFGNDSQASAVHHACILLAPAFIVILKLPNKRTQLFKKLGATMGEISNDLLIRSRSEKDANIIDKDEEKSIIGLLLRSEGQDVDLHMFKEEVMAQV